MTNLSQQRIELPSETTSPSAARRFVARHLEAQGTDDIVEIGTLLTSEIVTNAVLHAAGPIEVEVSADDRTVRVCVADHDPRLPKARPALTEQTSGRGLNLVDALATRWGAQGLPENGKLVWFELDLR